MADVQTPRWFDLLVVSILLGFVTAIVLAILVNVRVLLLIPMLIVIGALTGQQVITTGNHSHG